VKVYENRLPVAPTAVAAVKQILIEPPGVVVNAVGEQPFASPWPPNTVVSAKPGNAIDRSGRGVRWLIGHVSRNGRSFVFVSCVIGPRTLKANAAIDLAARSLRVSNVL
jgi:beta-lactamase class D